MTFWWFKDLDGRERDLVAVIDSEYEPVSCPLHSGHRRGGRRLTPMKFDCKRPPRTSFVWSWTNQVFVNEDAADELKRLDLAGYDLLPAFGYCKGRQLDDQYFLFRVIGWGGLASAESRTSLKSACPGCGYLLYDVARPDLAVDASRWDGSDFMLVWPMTGFRLVSDRAATILRASGLTGFAIEPMSAILAGPGGGEYAPQPLSLCMPDDRARAIGLPLGIY